MLIRRRCSSLLGPLRFPKYCHQRPCGCPNRFRLNRSDLAMGWSKLNLRLLTVHSHNQEEQTGSSKPHWNFGSKKWINDRVTSRPEIFLGQAILMEATLDGHATITKDIEKALFSATQVRVNAGKRDDRNLFAHFLDAGRAHDVHSIFDGHAQSLADFLQIAKPEFFSNCQSHEQKLELIGQMSALVFKRAQADSSNSHP